MISGRILVFTDVDGTLLDHHTYSWAEAGPALELLRRRKIPLIISTSKTRAEVEELRNALGNGDPFIVENGGAIFIPRGYFPKEIPSAGVDSLYQVIEFGTPYRRLVAAFSRIKDRLRGRARGFSDMSEDEVANLVGLSRRAAALARKREYDEPFLLDDPADIETVQKMASEEGLKVTRGSRFYHLTGENDKGRAVRHLTSLFAAVEPGPARTVGLGDSLNDLPMLEAVDFPVLVQKPGGEYDPGIRLSNLIFAPGAGPVGWAAAIVELLGRLDRRS